MKPWLWLVLAIALILTAVFPWGNLQGHTHWYKVAWIPFVSPPVRFRDVLGNILLFTPFGAAVAINTRRSRAVIVAAAAGAALSFLGETAQLYSHGRIPSATDLVCNIAGAALAAFLVSRAPATNRPPPG